MAPIPWNDDNQDGESSVQLLVGWLVSGTNYERWQGDACTHNAMCDEIVNLFKVHGIVHRTVAGIKMKIRRLETSVVHAQSILRENGHVDLANLDEADMSLMCDILGRYPDFDFVAPLMEVMSSEGLTHKPVASRSLGWDADRILERATMDALIEWITTAGNYDRWKFKTSSRASICLEINKFLHEKAIRNRSVAGIGTRIGLLERSLKRAVGILDRCGITGSIKLDSCDEGVKNEISQCCRHFEQLAPVMLTSDIAETNDQAQSSSTQGEEIQSAAEEGQQPEQRDRDPYQGEGRLHQATCPERGALAQEEKSSEANALHTESVTKTDASMQARWQVFLNAPSAPPETEEADTSTTKSLQTDTSCVLEPSDASMRDQTPPQPAHTDDEDDDGFEIVGVRRNGVAVIEACNINGESDFLRRQSLDQLEMEQKRAEYDHETKKRKIQLSVEETLAKQRLFVETVLARHRLLQAGLSQEYVDQLLPSCP